MDVLIIIGMLALGFAAQFFLMWRRPRFEWRALAPLGVYTVTAAWGFLRANDVIRMPYDTGGFMGPSGQWTGLVLLIVAGILAAGSATAAVGILTARLIKKLKNKKAEN